jgi:hypothetical protein
LKRADSNNFASRVYVGGFVGWLEEEMRERAGVREEGKRKKKKEIRERIKR